MNRIEELPHLQIIFQQLQESFKWKLISDIRDDAITENNEELAYLCRRAIDDKSFSDLLIRNILNGYALLDSKHVDKGKAFKSNGRGPNPLTKRIKEYLIKNPDAKSKAVWDALAKKPPKNHKFLDNSQGKYIENKGINQMDYRRFQNLVSEHRPKK